jgi:radical SAM superfamily enzyme YgiQ (UPF0313 family)
MNGTAAATRALKILLVSANRCTAPEPVFPLGLAHLSAVLRQAGHQVLWLDLLVESRDFETVLEEVQPDLVGISVRNIDDVQIRKRQTFVEHLNALVETVHRTRGCPVVLGGSGFSILPRELLQLTGADFGIVGEGERALLDLVTALATGNDYKRIPSLVFRQGATIKANAHATLASQLPLQRQDWPSQITSHYLRNGRMLNLQTQRGCPHRCRYCTYPLIEGQRQRSRPAEAVVAEFEQLQALGARYAFIVDSVFNSSERHVTDICEALATRAFKLQWGCFLRPQGLTRPLVRLMARAGLAHIEFGSDNFCDEVLEAYEKDLCFEDIRISSELARSEEIDFCHFVIAGGPGETPETLQRGYENSQQLGGAIIIAVPGMRIYPGTRLFQRAIAEKVLEPGTNLLEPLYYLAPGLSLRDVLDRLKHFATQSPNWILGDFDPSYEKLVLRLRQRGVLGPLWSYFSAAQRLGPVGPTRNPVGMI